MFHPYYYVGVLITDNCIVIHVTKRLQEINQSENINIIAHLTPNNQVLNQIRPYISCLVQTITSVIFLESAGLQVKILHLKQDYRQKYGIFIPLARIRSGYSK